MASEVVSDLSPAEQVAAGFALGVAGILAVRFSGNFVLRKIAEHGPKMGAKMIAKSIVEDAAIGSVPVLQVGTPITVATVGVSIITVSLWILGGPLPLFHLGLDILDIAHDPILVPDFVHDQPLSSDPAFLDIRSRGGALQALTYNPSRIDP